MANGYTALHGVAFERVELQLRAQGYSCKFACTYDEPAGSIPKDLLYTGKEGGWEMRRKIKAWCVKYGVTDYRIVRNTGLCAICTATSTNCGPEANYRTTPQRRTNR
ncbi:hypothetical protein [Paraburkholderia humisilvae]|uniref:Uncharacterized protein n=1 Tax=Paraburkholderia humisilvae TaxID=627669 RepID=A0A6J5DL46_9BURK|nr:hypothetical protein [Paraburkholderia humisilvae]CAB3753961.1 hypothetical protein LMG29542_02203 [Paraburkholderia humisilvae]